MPGKKLGQCQSGKFAQRCPHEAIEQLEKRSRQGLLSSSSKHAEQQSQPRFPDLSVIAPAAGYRTLESS
jgi:hypothetical protein